MRTVLAAAAILVSANFAHSADAVVMEPAPTAVLDTAFVWSGGYIGLQGGYAWTQADSDFLVGGSDDLDAGILGVHAGFNQQWDSFVLGVEGDVEYNFSENTYGDIDAGMDWQGSLRLRAGYAIDRTLIYGTAGVAFGSGYAESDLLDLDESETFVGWTAGAGVEHAFTDNWTGRLEYRYTDFGDEEIAGVSVDPDQHAVRIGISYKF